MTGVLVPRFADTAVRSVLRIHEERLRRQLAEEAGAAAQQAGGGPAQPELAQALIKGAPGAADAGAVVKRLVAVSQGRRCCCSHRFCHLEKFLCALLRLYGGVFV